MNIIFIFSTKKGCTSAKFFQKYSIFGHFLVFYSVKFEKNETFVCAQLTISLDFLVWKPSTASLSVWHASLLLFLIALSFKTRRPISGLKVSVKNFLFEKKAEGKNRGKIFGLTQLTNEH